MGRFITYGAARVFFLACEGTVIYTEHMTIGGY